MSRLVGVGAKRNLDDVKALKLENKELKAKVSALEEENAKLIKNIEDISKPK